MANARLITTNTIRYNSNKGLSQQRTLTFDAALLQPGENTLTLTVPGGDLQSGVVWDYLRLVLNQNFKLDGTPLASPATRAAARNPANSTAAMDARPRLGSLE